MEKELIDQINETMLAITKDYNKFKNKGNESAGKRVRANAQVIRTLMKSLRAHVLEVRKSRKDA